MPGGGGTTECGMGMPGQLECNPEGAPGGGAGPVGQDMMPPPRWVKIKT